MDIYEIGLKLLVFIAAGSIHEFAHAFVAHQLGDDTAKDQGRMTINPIPHIDPIGTILFPIIGIGIGWMKPVPVDTDYLKKPERDYALIAFAGPFSHIVQICFAFLILKLLPFNLFFLNQILMNYIWINFLLMGFNLLPIPPLDGGAILNYFLPHSLQEKFALFYQYGTVVLLAIIFLPKLLPQFPNLIHYWLQPFVLLFYQMQNLNTLFYFLMSTLFLSAFLLFLKKKNKTLQSYLQSFPFYNQTQKKHNPLKNQNPQQPPQLLLLAKNISQQKQQNIPPNPHQISTLNQIKQNLNPQANLCPPFDYNIQDQTCQNCEWVKNCLIRSLKN